MFAYNCVHGPAFPRMDSEGRTTLCLVTDTAGGPALPGAAEERSRPVTLGQLMGKLTHGTGALHCE